ncbi:MAG: succinate--CoA ligase subunit alpha [Anaerolineae bacterium]|nr:succinate--CoA ligase subunit alpha [Anaerolineae bacterium]
MSILIDKSTRLIVQGITGKQGLFYTRQMLACHTNIVGGVSPRKGGDWILNGKIPVFDTVKTAVDITGANASVIFVPARYAADAIYEAADAKIPLVFCITKGIAVADMVKICAYLKNSGTRLIGPNGPGAISPGEASAGIFPSDIVRPGNIGVVSRSGTLTYEVMLTLKNAGLGCSTCVGIGGDLVGGTDFVSLLELFNKDPHTEKIILVGEIGGNDEEKAAEYISSGYFAKPVVAYIAGKTAPVGKSMGHAGAVIEKGNGYCDAKIKALESVGVKVARSVEDIPELLK